MEGIVPQEIIEMQSLCGLETGWWQCESSPTILQPYQDLNPGVFPWFSISCLVAIFVFLLFSIPAFFLSLPRLLQLVAPLLKSFLMGSTCCSETEIMEKVRRGTKTSTPGQGKQNIASITR